MKKTVSFLFLIALGFALTACPPQKVVQPTPGETPPSQPVAVAEQKPGSSTEQKTTEIKPPERITETQIAKIETREEKPQVQYKELSDIFEDIHFNYDEYAIPQDGRTILEKVSAWMLKNRKAVISLEGHCDERGTNEYNLALGDRRAKAARDYLVALGIPADRIETISYGEEKPACSEKTENCWAKNRRVHIVILRETGKS